MALSMDEQRVLAEIERRLAHDDPVLAARLTAFRLPRLSLAPRSARSRLVASLLMLGVVAVISVFVYALMPFRSQPSRLTTVRNPAVSAKTAMTAASPSGSLRDLLPRNTAWIMARGSGQAGQRSASAAPNGR
jgi:hypothetical protein